MIIKINSNEYDLDGTGFISSLNDDGSRKMIISLINISDFNKVENDFKSVNRFKVFSEPNGTVLFDEKYDFLVSFDSYGEDVGTVIVRTKTNAEKIEELTPYTLTKTAYIDDTEIVFTDVPDGNMSVFIKDSEGNYPLYTVERSGDRVTVSFEALKQITTVTISIL